MPQPILGVEIPKSSGKIRQLGIPTVVDRWGNCLELYLLSTNAVSCATATFKYPKRS